MDVCEEDIYVTDTLRAYRPRPRYRPQAPTSPVFEESSSTRGLASFAAASVAMEDDGEADVGEIDEQEDCPGGGATSAADSMQSHDFNFGIRALKQKISKQKLSIEMDSVEFHQHESSSSDCFPAPISIQSHDIGFVTKSLKQRNPKSMSTTPPSASSSAVMPRPRVFHLPSKRQQPRKYRVVHTTADGKLTLRSVQETNTSTPAAAPVESNTEIPRMVTAPNFPHFVPQPNNIIPQPNNIMHTPLNINTGDESPSTSSSSSSSSYSDDYSYHQRRSRRRMNQMNEWPTTQQSVLFKDPLKSEFLTDGSNINNNNKNTNNEVNDTPGGTTDNGSDNAPTNIVNSTNVASSNCSSKDSHESGVKAGTRVNTPPKKSSRAIAQRKGRTGSTASSMKAPAPPRRTNGKRSVSNGPTLNGYGVPASIESMSSLKDFINYDNFAGMPRDKRREIASLLPSADVIFTASGEIDISTSALKNEYFSKSLDEYLNKGYRAAAMKCVKYPLCTGHNTRQRRRNEDQGIDLSPKDEWKKAYFETYWGEKSAGSSFDKSITDASPAPETGNAPPSSDVCKSLQLKQPVVKLTRAESCLGGKNEESLLKVVTKEENDVDPDSTPPVTPESGLPPMLDSAMAITQTPNSRASAAMALNSGTGTAKSRGGKWPRLRKRDQRNNSDSASAATSLPSPDGTAGGVGGTRKRRRRQSSVSPQLPLHRDTLCASLTAAASALSLVDEQAKANSTKTGSSSGPSNNSSSSPSTYGETSPQNEELGGHPSEFIKPRPPPPPANGVAAVAAAAAANMSLPSSVREKPFSGSSHHGLAGGAVSDSRVSRLNGKTVGESRRDISYRLMAMNQRLNTTLTSTPGSLVAAGVVSGGTIPTAPVVSPSLAFTPVHIKGAPGPQHPSLSAANCYLQPPPSAQRPRRKYALAARTFERQLQLRKEEEEEEKKEDCSLRRSKKSHEIRLKRLRERNSRRVSEGRRYDAAKTDDSIPPSSCPSTSSQADPCQTASGDWTSTAPATTSSDAKDTTCASSSTTVRTPSSTASTPQRPSSGVVRTRNGASYVYREKLCPKTLGNVCKRLPGADVRLSFGVSELDLKRLHENLTNLLLDAHVSDGSEPLPQLSWKIDTENRIVNLSFVEVPSAADSTPQTVKSRDKVRSTTPLSGPSSPCSAAPLPAESPSPSPACTAEVKSPVEDLPVTDTPRPPTLVSYAVINTWSPSSSPQPSLSPTTSQGISTHDSETVLSLARDDFLRESREKKYFHLNRRVLLD